MPFSAASPTFAVERCQEDLDIPRIFARWPKVSHRGSGGPTHESETPARRVTAEAAPVVLGISHFGQYDREGVDILGFSFAL